MPRLSHMIVDGMAFVLIGVGLTAVFVGHEHSPSAQVGQITQIATAWTDPDITGAIIPKASKCAIGEETTQPAVQSDQVTIPSALGSSSWSDPPRR